MGLNQGQVLPERSATFSVCDTNAESVTRHDEFIVWECSGTNPLLDLERHPYLAILLGGPARDLCQFGDAGRQMGVGGKHVLESFV